MGLALIFKLFEVIRIRGLRCNCRGKKKKTTRRRKKEQIELDEMKSKVYDNLKTLQENKLMEPRMINEIV